MVVSVGSAAYCGLADRIQGFVNGLERAGQAPSRGVTFHIVTALACLNDGDYGEGHGAMQKAETDAPLPHEAAGLPEAQQDYSLDQLRAVVDGMIAAEPQAPGVLATIGSLLFGGRGKAELQPAEVALSGSAT